MKNCEMHEYLSSLMLQFVQESCNILSHSLSAGLNEIESSCAEVRPPALRPNPPMRPWWLRQLCVQEKQDRPWGCGSRVGRMGRYVAVCVCCWISVEGMGKSKGWHWPLDSHDPQTGYYYSRQVLEVAQIEGGRSECFKKVLITVVVRKCSAGKNKRTRWWPWRHWALSTHGQLVMKATPPPPDSAAEFGRFCRIGLPNCWVSESHRFVLPNH